MMDQNLFFFLICSCHELDHCLHGIKHLYLSLSLSDDLIESSYGATMVTGMDHNWTSATCIYVDCEVAGCANNCI